MTRQDDKTIDGDIVLIRRIPPHGGRVQWGEDGVPEPSSQNFRDQDNELSTFIAAETTPEAVLVGHTGFGLVQFTAGKLRECFQDTGVEVVICRDEVDAFPGHVIICAKITKGIARKIRDVATWVENRWPAKECPEEL